MIMIYSGSVSFFRMIAIVFCLYFLCSLSYASSDISTTIVNCDDAFADNSSKVYICDGSSTTTCSSSSTDFDLDKFTSGCCGQPFIGIDGDSGNYLVIPNTCPFPISNDDDEIANPTGVCKIEVYNKLNTTSDFIITVKIYSGQDMLKKYTYNSFKYGNHKTVWTCPLYLIKVKAQNDWSLAEATCLLQIPESVYLPKIYNSDGELEPTQVNVIGSVPSSLSCNLGGQ